MTKNNKDIFFIARPMRCYALRLFLYLKGRLFPYKHDVIEFRNIRHFDVDIHCAKCGKKR